MKKTYPIYRVKTLNPITLIDWSGKSFSIPPNTIGTFRARFDPAASIPTPINQPDPIIIDAVFNGQKIVFRPKSYVPNGDIRPIILKDKDLMLLSADRNVTIKESIMSNIEGDSESDNKSIIVKDSVKSKSSSTKYIKQSHFILALATIGASSGFLRAKSLKGSVEIITLTTIIYGGVAAIAAWGLASIINDK